MTIRYDSCVDDITPSFSPADAARAWAPTRRCSRWAGETLLQRALAHCARRVRAGLHLRSSRAIRRISAMWSKMSARIAARSSGIQAALHATQTDLNLILSVDLPLMTPEFLAWLLQQARSGEQLITVPEAQGGLAAAVCGLSSRGSLRVADEALAEGDFKVTRLFARTTTRIIARSEIRAAGFEPSIFTQREHAGRVRDRCCRQLLARSA